MEIAGAGDPTVASANGIQLVICQARSNRLTYEGSAAGFQWMRFRLQLGGSTTHLHHKRFCLACYRLDSTRRTLFEICRTVIVHGMKLE